MLLSPHLRDRWIVQVVLQAFLLNSVLVTIWSNPEWLRFRGPVIASGWFRWGLAARAGTNAGAVAAAGARGRRRHRCCRSWHSSRSGSCASCIAADVSRPMGIFATVVVYVLVALFFARLYVLLIGWDPLAFDLPVPPPNGRRTCCRPT